MSLLLCFAVQQAEAGGTAPPEPGWTLSLGTEDRNLLFPIQVAQDPSRQRAFVYSGQSQSLAVVDTQTHEILGVRQASSRGTHLTVAPGGLLWGWGSVGGYHFDHDTGTEIGFEGATYGLSTLLHVQPLADGTTWLVGTDDAGSAAVRVDADLAQIQAVSLGDAATEARTIADDHVALYRGGVIPPVVEMWELGSGTLQASCPMAVQPTDWMPFDDTLVGIVKKDGIAVVDCERSYLVQAAEGSDNVSVMPQDGGFIVFDKTSFSVAYESEIRVYDHDRWTIPPVPRLAQLIEGAGRGGVDAVLDATTDVIWSASENSTSLTGTSVSSGEVVADISLGQHLESIAWDPDVEDRLWLTQRLNDRVVSVVPQPPGVVAEATAEIPWATAPELVGDKLWVVNQLWGELYALDADTLEVEVQIDLGFDVTDRNLMFTDLAYHPGRDSLFMTWWPDYQLQERDPDTGEVLATWPITMQGDQEQEARLEIHLDGDFAYVVRTVDMQVERFDLEGKTSEVNADLAETAESLVRLQYSALSESGTVLYVGPYAFNTSPLERNVALDRTWSLPIRDVGGCWLAWSEPDRLELQDPDGIVLWSHQLDITVPVVLKPEIVFEPAWGNRLLLADASAGVLRSWTVDVTCPD